MSERHVYHRPTKEVFYPFTMVTEAQVWGQAINGHYGALIDTNGDYAAVEALIPHDFAALEELAVRVIPNLATPTMTFNVMCSYGRPNELATTGGTLMAHSFGPTQAGGVDNATIREVDIRLSVANGRRSLRAKDQLGLVVYRVAGQNTNFYALGVRIKYKYK